MNLNEFAEQYVKLVLAVGTHDPDYVNAYYGPPEWKDQTLSLAAITGEAMALIGAIAEHTPSLRQNYLLVQTKSLMHRVAMLEGQRFTFDEESRALYDAVAPTIPVSGFSKPLAALEKLVQGEGPIALRYAAWQRQFEIPADRLDAVFSAATDEARKRTKRRIALAANESFVVEYVSKQVWSAYNWYKGDAHSLIQVNTDLPVGVNFALKLACHEGYPGHHVYNALLEEHLVRRLGWIEYSVYALYSPQSLIAEGTANFGVDLTFPPAARRRYLKEVLFPLAGLDASKADEYHQITQTAAALDHAVNTAARSYLDGAISRDECEDQLFRFALMTPERAAKHVGFIEKHRAYVINYNLGQDLIKGYMRKCGAPISKQAKAWAEFEKLLSSPRLPSGLR